jgi:hypothetical protein
LALWNQYVISMPSTTESVTLTSRSSEGSTECRPLLDVATKDLFRKNVFRITGLRVDATSREIGKHAERLKLLAELGQDAQPNAAFPLRPAPTVEDIRDAIQRLKDPEKRLIDEFFWFWPEDFGQSRPDAAIQALEKGDLEAAAEIWMSKRKHPSEGIAATHNLALIFHISALEWEVHSLSTEIDAKRREEVIQYWKAAFYRWGRILANEQLWEKVATRVHHLNEPNLTTGFVRRMRATLPAAFVKINAELALAFAESSKPEVARLHIELMRGTSESRAHVEKITELVLMPTRKRLQEQVRKVKERADANATDAITVGRELLEHARGTLALFDLFIGSNRHLRDDAFDEVAETCNRLQVTYHKATTDNETCLEFLKVLLPFAASQELREQIEKNITTLTENIEALRRDKKIYGNLQPISSAPSLWTINGIGFTLYGSTDVDATNSSYLTTYYFCFFFIPIFPICRYRVIRDGKAYRFLGKAPLRKSDKWHLAISLGAIISLMLALSYAGSQSTSPSPSYTPRYPPGSYSYSLPSSSAQPRSVAEQLGAIQSSADRIALAREKADLESERVRVQALDTEVEDLARQIERDRVYLDHSNEFEVDAFNAKVRRYNMLLQEAKSADAAFNQRVDDYNAKVRAQGR